MHKPPSVPDDGGAAEDELGAAGLLGVGLTVDALDGAGDVLGWGWALFELPQPTTANAAATAVVASPS